MIKELLGKIRKVQEGDYKRLPIISYSKLDNFKKCPMSHKLKYVDRHFSNKSSLAMEIGSIAHKGLEMKGDFIINGLPTDYEYIREIVMNGCDEGRGGHILGINELKKKYFEEFYEKDTKSGMNYDEKLQIYFENVLPTRMEDEWDILATEKRFEFVYDERVIIHGFIDRVDMLVKNGELHLRIVDYKSSKAVFRDTEIKTPLQHVIYDLGCLYLYKTLPEEHEYDFIFLDKKQGMEDGVCSKGYLKRGIKKINSLLDEMDEMEREQSWCPKPTPLCYWCPFHSTSPNADPLFAGMCRWHSLWTPDNKNFGVLNKWGEEKPRKLIF